VSRNPGERLCGASQPPGMGTASVNDFHFLSGATSFPVYSSRRAPCDLFSTAWSLFLSSKSSLIKFENLFKCQIPMDVP
jgi:hypothetical protein